MTESIATTVRRALNPGSRRRFAVLAMVALAVCAAPLAGIAAEPPVAQSSEPSEVQFPESGGELHILTAMSRARSNALQVQAARSRKEASEARMSQAKDHHMPRLSAQQLYIWTESPADAFGMTLNQKRFSFEDFVQGDPNNPDAVSTFITRFELEIPIYAGGEISSRIDQAEKAVGAADDTTIWVSDSASMAAAEAWIQLAQARENVDLLERALETVDAHVALAEAFVDQGMLVRSELLRAQVERSRIYDFLTEARGYVKVGEANLSFQMGENSPHSWTLVQMEAPKPLVGDLDSYLLTAMDRPDLGAARKMVEAAHLEARVHKARRLPRIGVMARYDFTDDKLFGSHGDAGSIMAMASFDIWNGGRHADARVAAEAEATAGDRDVERFIEGIRLQVRMAWEQAQTSRQRHATALAALDAAREGERITEARFEKGIIKMIDLLDASTARREAEARELVARSEAHQTAFRLALQSGRRPESVASFEDEAPTESRPLVDPEMTENLSYE